MVNVKIKFLNDLAKKPTKADGGCAGYDLYAAIPNRLVIFPHETIKIGTGIALELPDNIFGAIFARSGIATKEGLRPANCVGVCDSSYRGEYIVPIHNDSNCSRYIEPGERIAQLIFLPFETATFNVVNKLSKTERGDGGFGSTGLV